LIKRVHSVISASAKAAFSGKEVVSSLVFCDDFIHSYHFGVWDADSVPFLVLQTYSIHGDMSYGRVCNEEKDDYSDASAAASFCFDSSLIRRT
jgi:hypothetical protein